MKAISVTLEIPALCKVFSFAKRIALILLNSPVHFSSNNFNHTLNHSKFHTAIQFCWFSISSFLTVL